MLGNARVRDSAQAGDTGRRSVCGAVRASQLVAGQGLRRTCASGLCGASYAAPASWCVSRQSTREDVIRLPLPRPLARCLIDFYSRRSSELYSESNLVVVLQFLRLVEEPKRKP